MTTNSNYLNPILAVEQPREDLIRYLLTAYPLRDPHLRYGFQQLLEQRGNIFQEPHLEGSQPYRPSNSIRDLVKQGVLHQEVADIFRQGGDRPLYEHQEQAVKAVIQKQENIVVATGTGSGKTECFLIPMLNALLKEEENLSQSGVRTLILYPMNALVNDQVKRLRKLLCHQQKPRIKFGFYTSRTETEREKAKEVLEAEFAAYDRKELEELFTAEELEEISHTSDDDLIYEAIEKTQRIQCLSREEIWREPPHILITNYSMLEHMLIRPRERKEIFEASASTFKMLVVDEAHTYNGSTGSEVAMLIERLKVAVGIENSGQVCCIATSASLGNKSVDDRVLEFTEKFFRESFTQVIRGNRVTATERLGEPYALSPELNDREILEYLSILELPNLDDRLNLWEDQLRGFVPEEQLASAKSQVEQEEKPDIHQFLWFALKQHPLVHRLINILSQKPQPWENITQSETLWGFKLPLKVDGSINNEEAKLALASLLQLGTLARPRPDDLPLLPVRLHLLFRSLEGLYACINPQCKGVAKNPNYLGRDLRYGRLYLNEKHICEDCNSPVFELGSCNQCGQAYSFTQIKESSKLESLPRTTKGLEENTKIYTLTSGFLDSVTEEEITGDIEEEQKLSAPKPKKFIIDRRDGWIGIPDPEPFTNQSNSENEFYLAWYPRKDDKYLLQGYYLQKCAACGTRPTRAQAINRFVTYTDEPLEVMIDSIFELLPESRKNQNSASKRKLLTFSDGRQDAAFFASDYQRNHTEKVYRQMILQAFKDLNSDDGIASVTQVINKLELKFLETSIPHPDRDSRDNYLSYFPEDEESLENPRDCRDRAQKRAKELLLREFALPFNRRSTLEANTILACHIEFTDRRLIELIAGEFGITNAEAEIFLTVLTDIIRRTGIVSIEGSSRYFPETGGVEGMRPEMVDVQGKSQNYLFLEKLDRDKKKFPNSPSFLPKWKNDGQVSQAQNRLGWYYQTLFSKRFPNREVFQKLFQRLKDARLLVPAKNGYQLNWKKLNIIETQQDWYRCNSCQQIIHIPGLSELTQSRSGLNWFGCPAFRCKGQLQPHTPKAIEKTTNEHYQQYSIKKRSPLPLRSQEHTAQLGVGELERRENRFRQGKINMLSCSTTLEMGVDIGELQAVVLRNFPPHVSNYQQRAGRAGRRTDGVAVTLMYGQRRPHDRFYFQQPEELIAGSNQIPKLDADNFQIQQRHIRAELLAEFLLDTRGVGAEAVTIADFFDLPFHDPASHPNFTPPPTATIYKLQEWLESDRARSSAQGWIERLEISTTAVDILRQFDREIQTFQREQLADWNDLVAPLISLLEDINAEKDRKKRKPLEKRRDSIEAELEKIAKRRLHDRLVQASILPIYGFPIDVVRLLTGESNEFKSSQGRHRLERDRRLALGEYAPGQDIVVDDRVYQSVGILRPSELEQEYYWVCKKCNNFYSQKEGDPVEECSVCRWEPTPPSAAKMRSYKIPKAFTTDWSATPKVTPFIKPQRQPTSQVFLAQDGENSQTYRDDLSQLTVSQCGTFFIANQGILGSGKGFTKEGFAICDHCGRDLSELVREQRQTKRQTNSKKTRKNPRSKQTESPKTGHKHPITGKDCPESYFPTIHLGHKFRSDLLKIEFAGKSKQKLVPLFERVNYYQDGETVSSLTENSPQATNGMGFWYSLTYALLAAAAQVIDVPRTELDGLFTPLKNKLAQIIIYDNVPGGAGYSKRIAEHFHQVLEKAWEIVTSCSCDRSCYDCLRTYSNQPFHAQLDRQVVEEFLRDLVVKPDPELENFAPNASRVKTSQVAELLPAIFRRAAGISMIYLPSLIDSFELNNGSALPWLKLLTDAIYSVKQNSDIPLELILTRLPEPNTATCESERRNLQVLRKRLQQWIDQKLLKLYQTDLEELPILYLSTQQQNQIALKLHQILDSKRYEWFQTRSSEGVTAVLQTLHQLRSQARPIEPKQLEDPDTWVIFPEQSWGNLTIGQLRQKLQLERIFSGSKVKQIFYRDRYLNEAGARILANLLQSDELDKNTSVTIRVLEDSKSLPTSQRKAGIEKALEQLQEITGAVKLTIQPFHRNYHFPHARELEIHKQDGQRYKILFDKGMDFLEAVPGETYCVKEPTYIIVTKLNYKK